MESLRPAFDSFSKPSYERMICVSQGIESTLYIDPQAQRIAGFCPRCGGALYAPGYSCLRCREAQL
jgi:hypothetical protein